LFYRAAKEILPPTHPPPSLHYPVFFPTPPSILKPHHLPPPSGPLVSWTPTGIFPVFLCCLFGPWFWCGFWVCGHNSHLFRVGKPLATFLRLGCESHLIFLAFFFLFCSPQFFSHLPFCLVNFTRLRVLTNSAFFPNVLAYVFFIVCGSFSLFPISILRFTFRNLGPFQTKLFLPPSLFLEIPMVPFPF